MNQTFDPEALTELFALEEDSPGLVQSLVDEYVEVSLKLINEIQSAVSRGDHARLELESHSLKSSSKVLGLGELAACCLEIESAAREKRVDEKAISRILGLREAALAAIVPYMTSRS